MTAKQVVSSILSIFMLLCVWTKNATSYAETEENGVKQTQHISVLLIGCSEFPNIPNHEKFALPSTQADMKRARNFWSSQPSVESVVLLAGGGAAQLESDRPTRANILKALDVAVARTREVGNSVFYLMIGTHGCQLGGKTYFCPCDVTDYHSDYNQLDKTNAEAIKEVADKHRLIAITDILDKLEEGAGSRVLFLDACRTPLPNDKELPASEFYNEFKTRFDEGSARKSNLAILTSCTPNQSARGEDEAENKYGYFTGYFLDGLENGAADFTGAYDGKITLIEAYNYASIKTRRLTEAIGASQTPQYFGDESLQITVARSKIPEPYSDRLPGLNVTQGKDEGQTLQSVPSDVECVKVVSDELIRYEHYRLAEEALDFVLANEPSSPRALNLRGYARRAQKDYAGALEDFLRAGSELTLYVQANEVRATTCAPYILQGALIYPERGVELGVKMCCRDARGEPIRMVEGEQVVVDRVQGGWARLSRYLDRPIGESERPWVPLASLDWTRELAEIAIATNRRTTNLSTSLSAIQQATNSGQPGGTTNPTPSAGDR